MAMQAALERELVDLRQAHSQLLQAQSPMVAPPPGLHSSPFGAEAQQSERTELNGHSSVPPATTSLLPVLLLLFWWPCELQCLCSSIIIGSA